MKQRILIVEDQFIEANDLEIMLLKAGHQVTGIAYSVEEARTLISADRPDLVLVDIILKGNETGIDLAGELNEKGIPFIFISANSNHEVLLAAKATQPYGFIVKPFRERDLLVTLEIAQYRYENGTEANMRKEDDLRGRLKEIATEQEGWEQKMLKTAVALQSYIPFDYMVAGFRTAGEIPYDAISFLRVGFNEYQVIGLPELQLITRTTLKELVALQAATPTEQEACLFNGDDFVKQTLKPSMRRLVAEHFGAKSLLSFPVELGSGEIFNFFFFSKRPETYKREHIVLLRTFKYILTDAVNRMRSVEKSPETGMKPPQEDTLPARPATPEVFSGIVGKSHLLLTVFDNITQVAPADTSVLILGESGTGKERIAQCIHNLSKRSKHPLIRINCAALPANLIESELFGHEKGAFTGAMDKRVGKFELAHKGTIFLDEIGEMPVELQSKLLRVLQEKEIERIGGSTPIKIDVRIIAATNRELEKEVAAGRFRLDLYYRLNIFPVMLPALRERREDIALLADHFIAYFNRKIGKSVEGLSKEVLRDAQAYNWPGNIRELENLIERAVLLTKGSIITDLQLPAQSMAGGQSDGVLGETFKTIEDNEREHIMKALKKCHGKVWGVGGAAELLDLPPSTLNSRMKKLGIKRDFN